jgi:hypothetical protein
VERGPLYANQPTVQKVRRKHGYHGTVKLSAVACKGWYEINAGKHDV